MNCRTLHVLARISIIAVYSAVADDSVAEPLLIEQFLPSKSLPAAYEVDRDSTIQITFSTAIDVATLEGISITSNGAPAYPFGVESTPLAGEWSASAGDTVLTFLPSVPFGRGEYIHVVISPDLKSSSGVAFGDGTAARYSFIIDNGLDYPVTHTVLPEMAVVQHDDGSDHYLPLELFVPETGGDVPVMFWVHGGGWSGGNSGTMESSELKQAVYADYLARKLGIAVANVTWRSLKNSEGTFQKAVTDVELAIHYVRDNAATYKIDTSRMGLYGGSAGTPMSSLISQLHEGITCYIGLNGLYNMAERTEPYGFGGGTGFNQHIPSYEANSAITHIRVPGPATLLLHGNLDTTIEHQQSVLYAEAIADLGGVAKALIYDGETHAFFNKNRTAHIPTMYEVGGHVREVFGLDDISPDQLSGLGIRPQANGTELLLRWPSVPGALCDIERSTNLEIWTVEESGLSPGGNWTEYHAPFEAGQPAFFRIKLYPAFTTLSDL
jgi:acetyl esterase/lipase